MRSLIVISLILLAGLIGSRLPREFVLQDGVWWEHSTQGGAGWPQWSTYRLARFYDPFRELEWDHPGHFPQPRCYGRPQGARK